MYPVAMFMSYTSPVDGVEGPGVGQEGRRDERVSHQPLDHGLVRADGRLPPDELPGEAAHQLVRSLELVLQCHTTREGLAGPATLEHWVFRDADPARRLGGEGGAPSRRFGYDHCISFGRGEDGSMGAIASIGGWHASSDLPREEAPQPLVLAPIFQRSSACGLGDSAMKRRRVVVYNTCSPRPRQPDKEGASKTINRRS